MCHDVQKVSYCYYKTYKYYDDLSDENLHKRMIIWEYEHLGLMPKSNSGKKYLEKHLKNLEDTKN